ncbi:cation:proton antiporter [Paracoccus yeei]|uniref:Cation:proton antiporter n=1 Tax=Paracoccus yeei TaxID=147645 RepID=A0A1V0GWZ3_9RHOB|nr:monovalent cation/H(+) antiporter subunit G [Paracoccus yeei]ARC38189.1 cation:proton antiporter [Paracoccus yeei]
MRHLDQLPPTAALIIAVFVVVGSSLALLGSLGLVRLRSFYQRLHAPTLAYSYGAFLIILASMAMFSLLENRPVLHEIIIGVFLLITTPITLLMLGRAALRRDRDAKLGHDEQVPPRVAPEDRATEPARDLSHLGEDVPEGGVLAPPGQAEPEPGTGERSP